MGGGVSLINGHIDRNKTEFDRLKGFSKKEVADFLSSLCSCNNCPAKRFCDGYLENCAESFEVWLESEAK